MPVEDHEVHERTRELAGAVYGCHNKPRRRDPMMVKDGPHARAEAFDGATLSMQRWVEIPDFGSLECRYDMSLKDTKCAGCEHRGSGEAYDQQVREAGK